MCLPVFTQHELTVFCVKESVLVFNVVILRLYYQSLERDTRREKIQSEGELVVLASGSGHSEGAQK